ncbi:hypothetical protein [Colwellia psychrerythraea]|uniref:Uncharacterized protein n=1 Tax=Colwellia psychrerythraea TaxID=28229 RepID=A0A099KN27_COLPS|nr:hypothetical protein [Colwellia psychrerythraea]KGJ91347.1 hypothetical protein ND2E_3212 [Colwellia psychrerythraea]
MITDSKQLLVEQWHTLHNNHETYENYALIIKLVATIVTLIAFTFSVTTFVTLSILAILWLQEAIWKTFQQRTANAILTIEDKLALPEEEQIHESNKPYLVYKHWRENRPKTNELITEYLRSSIKPTVIYPYLPLMLLTLIF